MVMYIALSRFFNDVVIDHNLKDYFETGDSGVGEDTHSGKLNLFIMTGTDVISCSQMT